MHRPRRRFACAPRVESLELRALLSTTPATSGTLAVDPSRYSASHLLVRYRTDEAVVGPMPVPLAVSATVSPPTLVPGLREVELAPGLGVQEALAALRADPRVLYAEPDYRVHVDATPNDPMFGSQWGLNNTGQFGGAVDADVDAPEAWDVATGSRSTIVAVIDSGVDYNHIDLAANMWTNAGEAPGNGLDDDGNGFVDDVHGYDFVNGDGDPMDDNSHGTHVAGIIGAVGNNGIGVVGVSQGVSIMAVKFLDASGNGFTSAAIAALNYAVANGATISNNSWGGGGPSQALSDAIRNAGALGHIFVAAAGNGGPDQVGDNNDITPNYPSNYNLDNIVAVAATDPADQLAGFSNYGAATVDLAAPGVSILSTVPGGYGFKSGTSMATPMVTGAIALVRGQHPTWTYTQVINQVYATVDPVASLSGRVKTGGRLNAGRAVGADLRGASVVSGTPTGTVAGSIGSVRLTFSEPINPSGFTVADVVSLAGPSGAIAATGVTPVSGSGNLQFDVTFAPQSAAGSYSLTIGPDILDAAGNPMDQDGDGVNGEVPADRYTAGFAIAPPAAPPPGTRYVSDLPFASSTSGWGPVERDRSNADLPAGDGLPLTLDGVGYAKGLGVHASSDVRVDLGGRYGRFRAVVGVDDEVGPNGSVVFQVWADGALLYDSGVLTGSSASGVVDVDVSGRSTLSLVVTDAGDNFYYDHADWADARLEPAAPPPGTRYVSDLPFASSTSGWGPVERDRSNADLPAGDGLPLTLDGVGYAKGLGVHASSDVRVDLGGRYGRFRAVVGVDDEVGPNGSVVFQVWADGALLYDSGVLTGSSASGVVDVDVSGRSTLSLVVTDAGDNFYYDHADWADARLEPAAPSGTAVYAGSDAATGGSWSGSYGGQGYALVGLGTQMPGYASVSAPGAETYTWAGSTADPRALQRPGGPDRSAATWYSGGSFALDVSLSDGQAHRVSVYAVDWDGYGGGRSERVEVVDAATGAVLDSRTLSGFGGGVYLTWEVTGHVLVRVTNLNPAGNAVLSGLFLDAADQPAAIPDLATWESHMVRYGRLHAAYLASGAGTRDERLASTYYDAARVFYQIADYTGDASWLAAAKDAVRVYRDDYVLRYDGAVPGYWDFAAGLAEDYRRTGDAASRDAVLLLARNASYANAPPEATADAAHSREVAYNLLAKLEAESLGAPHEARADELAGQALGHIQQWLADGDPYVQPFMVGLTCEALIAYEASTGDARVLPAVRAALEKIWSSCWVPSSRAFRYQSIPADGGTTAPAPDLNLLIAPAYAWVYHRTGEPSYRDRADAIFAGGVDGAWLDGAKQFNQNYRWSFDYVKWRSEPVRSGAP